jgi:hypothetical protein
MSLSTSYVRGPSPSLAAPLQPDSHPRYPAGPAPAYAALSLPSPYETICGSYGGVSGYPAYQQPGYGCLAPYPPTSFAGIQPYQDPLGLAGYPATIASPDSCLKPELGSVTARQHN